MSRCVIALQNIKQRPAKADFGMRYIYRDFDTITYKMLEAAMKVDSIEKIESNFERLYKMYSGLKEELNYLKK